MGLLPVMYAVRLLGILIRQSSHAHVTTIAYKQPGSTYSYMSAQHLLLTMYVTGPAKKGMWANKKCLLFQILICHNIVFHDSVTMQFSAHIKHLGGFTIQVTE